jgi:hypothetical protein
MVIALLEPKLAKPVTRTLLSCDGRCQLPLLSLVFPPLSILLRILFALLASKPLLVGAGTRVHCTEFVISTNRHLTRTSR